MEIAGLTTGTLGTILIAYTALRVHHRVRKEHAIDSVVEKEMGKEMRIGVAGIALVIIGYVLQLVNLLA